MDFESECSVQESVEDNEVNPESVSHADENEIKNNGSCSNEVERLRTGENFDISSFPADREVNCVENFQPANSPPLVVHSPREGSPPVKKGYGLRKWRRIRRDVVNDVGTSLDGGKVLKRGLTDPTNPAKPSQSSAEARQNSEGSIGSVNMAKHRNFVDGFAARASSSDSRFAAGPAFAAGTDSDNSEDRSSKSSTAASVPKVKYDLPAVSGYAWEKSKVKNLSGKSLSNSTQRVQQTKSRTESSKKHRGEKVRIEKENSYSSLESDSRSTNFVFMQGTPNSNGKLSGTSLNFDGENSDEAHEHEEMQAGSSKEKVEEGGDVSPDDSAADVSWEAKEEKSENHQSSTDRDPLVESTLSLQLVQEALEKELQKFVEIGEEHASLGNNSSDSSIAPADSSSADPEIVEPSSSDQMGYEKIKQSSSSSVLKLTQSVRLLESELEQTRNKLQEKDLRLAELESTLRERNREMETQIEDLFKQKIEAEIECVIRATEMHNHIVHAVGEQKAKVLHKLGETENKAEMIKKEADDDNLPGAEDIVKMQRRACRVMPCFLIQLILLLFVLWPFLLKLSPESRVVVPT